MRDAWYGKEGGLREGRRVCRGGRGIGKGGIGTRRGWGLREACQGRVGSIYSLYTVYTQYTDRIPHRGSYSSDYPTNQSRCKQDLEPIPYPEI